MKKILLLLTLIAFSHQLIAQCTVNANATQLDITCGEYVTLSHFGSTSGNISFQENFNNGAATGWGSTQQATYTNPCSSGGVDGTTHMWMGDNSGVPRHLTTIPLNFGPSVAPAGGTICFDLLFAEQGDASPCEGPDESDEGVYLQYSTDGTNWITIHYFDPNGGNDPQLINWNNWCFAIPSGALTNGVRFRWFQDADSGAGYDHWGIDNVQIIVNDPNVSYTWSHDGYTTPLPGDNPTAVNPHTTTTYTVTMTTSSGTCTQNVTINVVNPTVLVNAGPNLQVCPGQCVNLQGTASVVNDPGGIKTFANNQTEDFSAGVFSGGAVNVNVQGLNMNNVNPGSLQKVCITNLRFSGFNIPPSGVETLSLILRCPDGTEVTLVPIAGAPAGPGGFFGQASYYQNVCFVTSGGATLSSVTGANATPITGTFNSSQPLSGVNGCTANGEWSIKVASNALTGNGTFDGWSITFDDEIDEYTPDITWSPTTFMTAGQETTLTPTVCPTADQTYTITVSDTAGCVTVSDNVIVTTDGICCALEIDDLQVQNGTCGTTGAGSITIIYSGETTGLKFSINNGTTYQNSNVFSNLNPGTYQIRIIDDANCPVNRTVVIPSTSGPTITNVTPVNPTCGNTNGSLTITATGGATPYSYSIDNGTTTQTTNSFTNLGSATYQVVVKDANNCQATQSVQLTTPNAPTIDDVTLVQPSCGATNGSLTVVATGGVAPLRYSLDGGTSQTSATFSGLGEGDYEVTVSDANGCEFDETVTLTEANGPSITNSTPTNPSCNGTNGAINIVAAGGAAPLTYSVDGGTTTQATGNVINLGDGTYNIVVSDANGCDATATVTLTDGPGPLITAANTTAPDCGAADGSIIITATGGTAPLDYSIDGGTTSQATGTFNNLSAATYNVVVADANGCEATQTVILNTTSAPNVNAGADITICAGETVTLTATGATTYSWTNGVNNGVAFTPTTTTTYTVTGTDAAGCTNTDVVTVTVVPIPTAGFTPDVTAGEPVLNVVFTNTSTNATSYIWDFGNGTTPVVTTSNGSQNASFGVPGVYIVELTAANGNCVNTFSMPITVENLIFNIYVPNVFTPNGDNSNDEFFIRVENGKTIEVNIFNRWGNKMFEIGDFKTRWNGQDASEGVYFFTYVITGLNGETKEGQGHVTLIRK